MKKVSQGQYVREGPIWDSLSEGAKDLIQGMLCVDPEMRLSATEALNHPWFH